MNRKIYDIVTLGHALVDIRLKVNKFPSTDEEATILEEERGAGGSAVNVAIDVSILGGKSAVMAKIGFDSFGRMIYDELWNYGVDLNGLKITPEKKTGFSIVIIDKDGNIAIYGSKGAAEQFEPREVSVRIIELSRILHIASLRLDTSIKAASIARENETLVSWDPGRRLAGLGLEATRDMLKLTDIVFVNRRESMLLTKVNDPEKAARKIASAGPKIVVVKLGADGALLYSRDENKVVRSQAYKPANVTDTTGAGDAFASGFLLALTRQHTVEEALYSGLYVAARKIERLGSHSLPSGITIPPKHPPDKESE